MSKALFIVVDKGGIINFAKKLKALYWDIISSDGTAKILKKILLNVVKYLKLRNFLKF
jgi:AICAR transformylase/IMP cyclohydrolase PurH